MAEWLIEILGLPAEALKAIGIEKGVTMHTLPIAGALATPAEIAALRQRDDVVSIYYNAPLRFFNKEQREMSGAARVVLAVPVAPPGWEERMAGVADEHVAVTTPSGFQAVGQVYDDFSPTSDEEVVDGLSLLLPLEPADRQELLEMDSPVERALRLITHLRMQRVAALPLVGCATCSGDVPHRLTNANRGL